MRRIQVGLVMDTMEDVPSGTPHRWEDMRRISLFAEERGFDTVWVPDELLWQAEDWPEPRGWWEGVTITSAVAEATKHIRLGSWVLSALHRNPALTAKVATTLDEVSGGRFILGFGAGHSGRQGAAFGYPPDAVISRYEEALEILVPLMRDGAAALEGTYHRAEVVNRPPGPRPGAIPLMLGGHRPRTIALAARYADTWSGYADGSSQPVAFVDRMRMVDEACEAIGRDPKSLGRSIGVWAVPAGVTPPDGSPIVEPLTGTAEQIAEQIRAHAMLGATSLELMVWPHNLESVEAISEVLPLLA